jgi:hypothetical protein
MAANGITAEDIETVVAVTSLSDRGIISNALRSLGNVDKVLNEYLDDPVKVSLFCPSLSYSFLLWLVRLMRAQLYRSSCGSMAGTRAPSPRAGKARLRRQTTPTSLVGYLLLAG